MRSTHLLLPIFALFWAGCATAQQGCIAIAYESIGKGDYQKAISYLKTAEKTKKTTPALQAEILFLHARADEGQKLFANAKKHYQNVINNFPDSIYAYMAKECLKRLMQETATDTTFQSATPTTDTVQP